jgi:hypothetical protein
MLGSPAEPTVERSTDAGIPDGAGGIRQLAVYFALVKLVNESGQLLISTL